MSLEMKDLPSYDASEHDGSERVDIENIEEGEDDSFDMPEPVDDSFDMPEPADDSFDMPETVDDSFDMPETVDDSFDMPETVDDSFDMPETVPECFDHGDCDDDNVCNGVETCDIDSHVCLEGTAPGDGYVCLDSPRSICLGGECAPSVCGDGYVDSGASETCEPPGEGGCDSDCHLFCTGPGDCPDDGNICNGEEYCDELTSYCSHRNPPVNGTPCEINRYCCDGECLQCCEDVHCDDSNECTINTCGAGICLTENQPADTQCTDDDNPCTRDICNGGRCTHPAKENMTTCGTGMVCCGGTCYTGDCCEAADCPEPCSGTAAACESIIINTSCSYHDGCEWKRDGICENGGETPYCTVFDIRNDCTTCGCRWNPGAGTCTGGTVDCPSLLLFIGCRMPLCGCVFYDPGCYGTATTCDSFGAQSSCESQLGCTWTAVCNNHTCE